MLSTIADNPLIGLLLATTGYLLGSLSSAVIVCRLSGLPDPRETGSNNAGATNVLRLGGKKPAAMTLVGDMLKGLVATLIAQIADVSLFWVAVAGLMAVIGHMYPLFFGFRGGKGVATGLGAILGTHWITGLLAICIWLATCLVSRISSLSALISFAAVPPLLLLAGLSPVALVFLVISVLLFWRHRDNIGRLLKGAEPRVGEKKSSA